MFGQRQYPYRQHLYLSETFCDEKRREFEETVYIQLVTTRRLILIALFVTYLRDIVLTPKGETSRV